MVKFPEFLGSTSYVHVTISFISLYLFLIFKAWSIQAINFPQLLEARETTKSIIIIVRRSVQNIHPVDGINPEFSCPAVVHILKCAGTRIDCDEFHE
jgi:uncharacterized membrane protein YwzB